jgi:hypothetical protein
MRSPRPGAWRVSGQISDGSRAPGWTAALSLRDLLMLVTSKLVESNVPYMLTGSLAGSFHGAPRATQDIGLVVGAPLERLLELAASLRESGMYVSDEAVQEAHRTAGMFNAIDPGTGWKIDFSIRKRRPFSEAEFQARQVIDLWGMEVSIASAEDMIVAKLEWAQMGDSERQLRDVVEILKVQGGTLDRDRIQRWVEVLGLEAAWARARGLSDVS